MEGIRKAAPGDLEEIYRLICALEGQELDLAAFSEIFIDHLENPEISYLVYEHHNELLGFISIHIQNLLHHAAPVAEIQELIVAEKARRMGIGRLLFEAAKEDAASRNCLQMEVCCNQARKGSHRFYEAQLMTNQHFKFTLPLYK